MGARERQRQRQRRFLRDQVLERQTSFDFEVMEGPAALERRVLDVLKSCGVATAPEVAKVLELKAESVGGALERLADRGEVELAARPTKTRRWKIKEKL